METLCHRGFILKSTKRALVLLKTVLGIFKIALRLRGRHVFMWHSLEILNVFNTLNWKQIIWKTKPFLKNRNLFWVESTKIENATFSYKTSYKELICCTNYPNVTFRKHSSFTWEYFFPVSNLKRRLRLIMSFVFT